jgi:hypothetical protein
VIFFELFAALCSDALLGGSLYGLSLNGEDRADDKMFHLDPHFNLIQLPLKTHVREHLAALHYLAL